MMLTMVQNQRQNTDSAVPSEPPDLRGAPTRDERKPYESQRQQSIGSRFGNGGAPNCIYPHIVEADILNSGGPRRVIAVLAPVAVNVSENGVQVDFVLVVASVKT